MIRDGWLLASGTLTVIRWPAPRQVDRHSAAVAMVVAPLAVLPLGLLAALVVWGGGELALPPLAIGLATVGALALGSRALHLDGLSDVADSLTASHDRVRSLEVMKGGTAGPAGAATLVIVLGLQSAGIATLSAAPRGWLVVGVLVCLSRAALSLCCTRGVPAARDSGLAVAFAGTVPMVATVLVWSALIAATAGVAVATDLTWGRGLAVAAALLLGALAVLERCWRRHGGVTGDCFGASIEVSLAAALVTAAAAG